MQSVIGKSIHIQHDGQIKKHIFKNS